MRKLIPYAGAEPFDKRKGPLPDNRVARIDLRLTIAEKEALDAKAKAKRRTVSSIMVELIENLDKIIP